MPVQYQPQTIDFYGALTGIGQTIGHGYQKRKLTADMQEAFGPDGSIQDWNKAYSILAKHDPIAALKFQADREGTQALNDWRFAQLNRPPEPTAAMRDADHFASMPPGDPRLKYAPRGSAKPLNRQVVNDLSTKGELAFKTNQFSETFKDEYGGWGNKTVGDTANAIARYTGIGDEGASSWWQDYSRHRNVVRNQLFGSALTTTEARQWEQADINPGMTPDAIRANLKVQQEASERAARKLGKVYVRQGADRELVEEALGVSLDDLEPAQQNAAPRSVPTMNVSPDGAMSPTRPPIETPALQAEVAKGGFGKQPPTPPKRALDALSQYANNPEARAAFDEIYGPGAAEFYLQRTR